MLQGVFIINGKQSINQYNVNACKMSKRSPLFNKSPSPAPSRSPIVSKSGSSSSLAAEDPRLKEALLADLEAILSDESTSDLEFVLEEERIRAHRLIVLARCEKFKSKKRAWLENRREEECVAITLEKPCTVEGVRSVVKYLYTGKVSLEIWHTCIATAI